MIFYNYLSKLNEISLFSFKTNLAVKILFSFDLNLIGFVVLFSNSICAISSVILVPAITPLILKLQSVHL